MFNNKKNLLIILTLLCVISLVAGGTYAWLKWEIDDSQQTLVTFTIESGFSCSADGGGDITSSTVKLAPANCNELDYVLKRTIKVNTRTKEYISLDLWLNNISDFV